MAILQIRVPDSAILRLIAAFQVTTRLQLEARLQAYLRAQVGAYESSQLAVQNSNTVQSEDWNS